jgi:hypothetical protein
MVYLSGGTAKVIGSQLNTEIRPPTIEVHDKAVDSVIISLLSALPAPSTHPTESLYPQRSTQGLKIAGIVIGVLMTLILMAGGWLFGAGAG